MWLGSAPSCVADERRCCSPASSVALHRVLCGMSGAEILMVHRNLDRHDECPICLEALGTEQLWCHATGCGHFFHKRCIADWHAYECSGCGPSEMHMWDPEDLEDASFDEAAMVDQDEMDLMDELFGTFDDY